MSDSWARLWRICFGQPPPLKGDDAMLARVLIESLPCAPPYQPKPARRGGEPARGNSLPEASGKALRQA